MRHGLRNLSRNQANLRSLVVDGFVDMTGVDIGDVRKLGRSVPVCCLLIGPTYSNVLSGNFRLVTKRVRKPAVHEDEGSENSSPVVTFRLLRILVELR